MFEYRVEICAVREAQRKMNLLAGEGWRVIAVTPNVAMGHGIVVTFEREKKQEIARCIVRYAEI